MPNTECPPLPIFRHNEEPTTSTDCSKDEAARRMYADVAPATAQVFAGLGTGSGFFIQDGSRIVTNAHVVLGQRDLLTVKAFDGQTYQARIEKLDDINDLAVLRLENNAHNSKALKIGSSTAMANGDDLYFVGHPDGRSATFISPGTLRNRYALSEVGKGTPEPKEPSPFAEALKKAGASSPEAQKDLDAYAASERLDMYAHGRPGSSGSAVVDNKGEVIGVMANGAIVDSLKEYSWSVPSEKLQALLANDSKFDFNYTNVSTFRSSPILASVITGGVSALTLGLPRVGGTAIGGLNLLFAPSEFREFMEAKDATDRLYHGLNLTSTAGFVTGAVLSYFPAARTLSRIATVAGIGTMVGSALVPHQPYLTEIHRNGTTGDTRPPFLWDR